MNNFKKIGDKLIYKIIKQERKFLKVTYFQFNNKALVYIKIGRYHQYNLQLIIYYIIIIKKLIKIQLHLLSYLKSKNNLKIVKNLV